MGKLHKSFEGSGGEGEINYLLKKTTVNTIIITPMNIRVKYGSFNDSKNHVITS